MDEGETPSEALKRAEDRNIATVAAVMRALMGEQVGEMEFNEYEEFMNLAASALQPFEGTPVCLKVLPDKKNTKYTTIPDRRFIDTFVEGFPTNLRFSKKELELLEQVEKAVE